MRFSALILSLILACVCLTLAQGSYEDCCLRYVKSVSRRTMQRVVCYRRQETDGSCNIPAIVFTLRKGKMFCADPKKTWVQNLMQRLDKPLKRPKKSC